MTTSCELCGGTGWVQTGRRKVRCPGGKTRTNITGQATLRVRPSNVNTPAPSTGPTVSSAFAQMATTDNLPLQNTDKFTAEELAVTL